MEILKIYRLYTDVAKQLGIPPITRKEFMTRESIECSHDGFSLSITQNNDGGKRRWQLSVQNSSSDRRYVTKYTVLTELMTYFDMTKLPFSPGYLVMIRSREGSFHMCF